MDNKKNLHISTSNPIQSEENSENPQTTKQNLKKNQMTSISKSSQSSSNLPNKSLKSIGNKSLETIDEVSSKRNEQDISQNEFSTENSKEEQQHDFNQHEGNIQSMTF